MNFVDKLETFISDVVGINLLETRLVCRLTPTTTTTTLMSTTTTTTLMSTHPRKLIFRTEQAAEVRFGIKPLVGFKKQVFAFSLSPTKALSYNYNCYR